VARSSGMTIATQLAVTVTKVSMHKRSLVEQLLKFYRFWFARSIIIFCIGWSVMILLGTFFTHSLSDLTMDILRGVGAMLCFIGIMDTCALFQRKKVLAAVKEAK
jgi:hypothetical protein